MVAQNRAEKLVDDVMAFICHHGIAAKNHVGFRREDAKQLITRIGKAYAEGEIPFHVVPRNLPGEMARILTFEPKESAISAIRRWAEAAVMNGADCFIALRKEKPND